MLGISAWRTPWVDRLLQADSCRSANPPVFHLSVACGDLFQSWTNRWSRGYDDLCDTANDLDDDAWPEKGQP